MRRRTVSDPRYRTLVDPTRHRFTGTVLPGGVFLSRYVVRGCPNAPTDPSNRLEVWETGHERVVVRIHRWWRYIREQAVSRRTGRVRLCLDGSRRACSRRNNGGTGDRPRERYLDYSRVRSEMDSIAIARVNDSRTCPKRSRVETASTALDRSISLHTGHSLVGPLSWHTQTIRQKIVDESPSTNDGRLVKDDGTGDRGVARVSG